MKWVFRNARESFERYRALWDELNHRHVNHILLDSHFVGALVHRFGSSHTLLGIAKSSSYPGMVLIERERAGFWTTFQPAQAPLGLILLGNPDHLEIQMEGLLESLPGYALGLGVRQQDPEISFFEKIFEHTTVERVPYIRTPRLTIRGTFDEYWQARGKDLRGNLTRRIRRLEEAGIEVELRKTRDPGEIGECIRQYGRLEGSGWKGREGTAVTADNQQGAFYRDMLEQLCKNGEGVVYQLLFDGKTVASDLCVERAGMLIALKIAYDETQKHFSPSFLMRQKVLGALFGDEKTKVVEFYGRLREWHTKWTDEVRLMYHVNWYRHPVVPIGRRVIKRSRSLGASSPERESHSLKVERYQRLDELPKSYCDVFRDAGKESFFLTLPWFQNYVQTLLTPNERILIYGVVEESKKASPIAVLLLRCTQESGELLPHAKIEALSNYYTGYFGPAVRPGATPYEEIAFALVSALWEDRYLWNLVDLRPMDRAAPMFQALVKAFKHKGMIVQTFFTFGNWYLDVRGRTYADYLSGLSGVLRKNIPYLSRRLEKVGRVRFEIVSDIDDVDRALDDYETVYNASWREPEPYPQFIRGFARIAAEQGWLRLGILYLNDQPAAAQIWIVHQAVASIYKICYREQFSKLSLGTVLTAHLMRHALDVDKVSQVDYLSGDDAHKKNWMSGRRERWGLMAFNPRSIFGLLHALRHVAGRAIKRGMVNRFKRNM